MRRATAAPFRPRKKEAEWHDRKCDNCGEEEYIGITKHLGLYPENLIDPSHGRIMGRVHRISHRFQRLFITRDELVERLMEWRSPLCEIGLMDLRPLDDHGA